MSVTLIVGLALLAGGLLLGKVFVANFELETAGKVRKAVGVLAVVVGALLTLRALGLIGAPVHPGGAGPVWEADPFAAEARASAEKRPLMLDFSAEWCKACKELEAHTFSEPGVAARLAGWVTVRVDLTNDRPELKSLTEKYKVRGLPTVAFVTADGRWLEDLTLTGFEPASEFMGRLDRAESGLGAAKDETLAGRIKAGLQEGSFWVFALVFLAGVVGSLSPCVYPLIPITISLFGARSATSRMQGFLLSLVYVLGIAVTYSALGVLAATSGGLFGSALQSPWVVGTVAIVFLAMGLSMLGVFEIRLPDAVNQRLNSVGGGQSSRFATSFLMGTVAGIVAAPCVGPPLVAVLAYVATTGSMSAGITLLSIYSLGMGVLFIFLGTFTQYLTRIPKSGGWMEVIKGSMGIVMLVVGLVYFQDVVPFMP
ncbi:sulfite exporter TauE/SafE family protein [Myxococcota bacterium]|nr:sulfite exporter TauE/SafE family protein [Myxococcota bacterium]